MGIRIHTAIGWGMPFDQFQRHVAVPDMPARYGDEWSDRLEQALAHTSDMRGPYGLPLPITDKGTTAFDLISTVSHDECSDVILFPTVEEMRRWKRYNDDLDYAMHWGTKAPDHDEWPMDDIAYLQYGHHPYGNLRMAADGTEIDAPHGDERYEWERDASLLPGVPPPLRHWIAKSGLMGLAGIAALRPIRAVWWS